MPRIPVLLTKDIPTTGDAILSSVRRWRFAHSYDHTLLIQMAEWSSYGYRSITQEQLKVFLLEHFQFHRMTIKGERTVTRPSVKLVSYIYHDPHDVLIKETALGRQ